LVSPVIVHEVEVVVQNSPPGCAVARYWVTASELLAAFQDTVIWPLPGTEGIPVGIAGAVTGGIVRGVVSDPDFSGSEASWEFWHWAKALLVLSETSEARMALPRLNVRCWLRSVENEGKVTSVAPRVFGDQLMASDVGVVSGAVRAEQLLLASGSSAAPVPVTGVAAPLRPVHPAMASCIRAISEVDVFIADSGGSKVTDPVTVVHFTSGGGELVRLSDAA
jgi:hypothetical protein